jgi:MEDS: MEthanogen/methylotroph, DcmR Sensory domain
MEAGNSSIQCAGGTLGRHRHVCAFFNSIGEEHRVLGSFVRDGLDRGEKATHIVDPEKRQEHLKRLAEVGVNVQQAMATGQLEVLPWSDIYVRDHRFDQDAMLAEVEKAIQSGAAAGYPLTRLVGHHMDWALRDESGVNNLVEYESRLNDVICKYNDPVICTYDLSKFGATVLMDILRTHPVVIIGGILQENPFFVPPDRFLRERQSLRKSAETTK